MQQELDAQRMQQCMMVQSVNFHVTVVILGLVLIKEDVNKMELGVD